MSVEHKQGRVCREERTAYWETLLLNIATMTLPALYATLSKLWVASIDPMMVATTDTYVYLGVIMEVMNEGLPRTAYLIIGDRESRSPASRWKLANTVLLFQTMLGLLMSICFLGFARNLVQGFVPAEVREKSVTYVRIASFNALSGAIETSVSSLTRALDRADVPLVVSTLKFLINIILDMLLISKFRPGSKSVSANTQAAIQLACNLSASLIGLIYFLYQQRLTLLGVKDSALACSAAIAPSVSQIGELSFQARSEDTLKSYGTIPFAEGSDFVPPNQSIKSVRGSVSNADSSTEGLQAAGRFAEHTKEVDRQSLAPSISDLYVLIPPGLQYLLESAIRNALYLWLTHQVVSMGLTYATAWGVFNTMRWGLVMVPVSALEQTSAVYVGHAWGLWRHQLGVNVRKAQASTSQILTIMKPALVSVCIVLAVEIPLCLGLSFGAKEYAFYLSNSQEVSDVAGMMWRTLDWCYIFYGVSAQLATILVATKPTIYLIQALASNFLYVLPWTIYCQSQPQPESEAWKIYKFVFGGPLLFSFVTISAAVAFWAIGLHKGWFLFDKFRQ